METFVFRAEIEQDEDGIWEAEIPVLPACAVWGYTREEALDAMQDVAQVFVEVMLEGDEKIPVCDDVRLTSDLDSIISVVVTTTVTL